MSRWAAVILAAGRGSRMKSGTPKQFLDLAGKPMIWYSLDAFTNTPAEDLILVVPAGDTGRCRREYVERYGFTKVKAVVEGGRKRYDSVYAGLLALKNLRGQRCDYVAIHDGARPLVTPELIIQSYHAAEKYGACVAAVPVKDTIKRADANQIAVETLPREELWAMQTPQAFRFPLCLSAYEEMMKDPANRAGITDDAMVVEHFGKTRIHLTLGDYRNLKVTTPEDLIAAEAYLEN